MFQFEIVTREGLPLCNFTTAELPLCMEFSMAPSFFEF